MPFWERWFGKIHEPDPDAEARAEGARIMVAALLDQTRRQMEQVKEREARIHGGRQRPHPGTT